MGPTTKARPSSTQLGFRPPAAGSLPPARANSRASRSSRRRACQAQGGRDAAGPQPAGGAKNVGVFTFSDGPGRGAAVRGGVSPPGVTFYVAKQDAMDEGSPHASGRPAGARLEGRSWRALARQ
jgi:hypothetical protein